MATLDQIVIKIKKDLATMPEFYDHETVDMLLSRDWFHYDDDIEDVLDRADDNAFNYVYDNRHKYSTRIRMIIEPNDFKIPIEKLKIRVLDLTDKMIVQMESERKKKFEDAFEKEWIEHAKTINDRPLGEIDSKLDDAWEALTQAKNTLQNYLEKPTSKKYVAPTSRRSGDTKQSELEDRIQRAENEYERLQKEEEDIDTLYWTTKRDDYRKIWMPNV